MVAVLHWHEGEALPPGLVHLAVRACRSHQARAGSGARRRGRVVVVDGRSGSGKTTLADRMAPALRIAGLAGAQVAHPDSWYPGWHGLRGGTRITEDLLTGARPAWPRWDWAQDRVERLVAVSPDIPLVVEGAGALSAVTASVADLRSWVDADDGELHRRAMERDGDAYRPWWDMWSRQEEEHLARNHPRCLADVVVRT